MVAPLVAVPTPTETLTPAWLVDYLRRGFRLVSYAAKRKHPVSEDWPNETLTAADYRPGDNIGVVLGHEVEPGKFLVDIDFDWDGGEDLAKRLMPKTMFGFGRDSRRLSHVFFTTDTALANEKFTGLNGETIVEIRGTKKDGTLGLQTMVPPSIHPNGERLVLRWNGDIGHVTAAELRFTIATFAAGCLLLMHVGPKGFGHDTRLAFAGTFLKRGVSLENTIAIGRVLADRTDNDADDVEACVRNTAATIAKSERVTNTKALARMLGESGAAVVERIEEWLARPREALKPGDILIEGGNKTAIVDQAEVALLAAGRQIFQRGGALIRPVRVRTASQDVVRRAAGATVLISVRDVWLTEAMGQAARWFKHGRGGDLVRCDPPGDYAQTLLARGEWKFPTLRAVVSAPTLAVDARIVEAPGFDPDSGLLLDFEQGAFPPVPPRPSRDDARVALDRLARPLRDFPFVDDAAKSVALSAMLTAQVRASLRTAPLHAFDAPTAGTGKSLLAEIVGLVATGVRPPALSQGKTAEEDEKRLATVAMAGDSVVHIDNCEREVTGDFICSWLSQEVVQVRVLGQSERRVLPSVATVLVSGNNLTLASDMCRRAVLCRLDAKVERPDQRAFDFDCHAEVIADRAALVVAGLTVLRAYHVAGRPERLKPVGGFADWDWIRGALVWLGCADPANTRESILDQDPRRDELTTVMDLWQESVGKRPVEVATIDLEAIAETTPSSKPLRDRLVEVACKGAWNGRSVGWWLTRRKDRVVGGRAFRSEQRGKRTLWWLDGAQPADERSYQEVLDDIR